ncbi:hypothetical protein [Acidocella sp.]|uniref:hypothetical protein n=1 Tax=Acidocella sp. TaxID=50710 RepID=UPI003D008124
MSSVPSPPVLSEQEYPGWIKLWFALDAALALLPPIYWAASGPTPAVFGLPLSVFYFILTGASITGSIVTAYAIEVKRGNFEGMGTHHVTEGEP